MEDQPLSKELILEKCSAAFREKGYSNTSIAMLAGICGISKSHFYYYFASKEVLMEELLKEELRYFADKVFLIAYEEAFSPRKRLKKLFKKLVNACCEGNKGSLMTMTVFHATNGEGERFYPIIRQYYAGLQKALLTIFSQKYGGKKSQRLANSTLLQLEGAITFLVMDGNTEVFIAVTDNVLANFTKA